MENHGLIIRHLRLLAGLSVQLTAEKIGRSKGWISEIENNTGNCKLTESEFNRIVEALEGTKHRSMFKTWAATYKNRDRTAKTYDGAVLRFIRLKKGYDLAAASKLVGLSLSYISKIETGAKPVTLEMRNQIMTSYGYSPSSFKNLSTDPIRSKVVPCQLKLEVLLHALQPEQIESVFNYAQSLITADKLSSSAQNI